MRCLPIVSLLILLVIHNHSGAAEEASSHTRDGDRLVAEYFAGETAKLSESSLSDIQTLDDWKSQRDVFQLELREMLGLQPWPNKTELHPVITGTLASDEFIVEKLHFQSLPGLYITGNLYRPKQASDPLPAILYVCGHGRETSGGVSVGNKTHYQHHGEWFARNGYVCLVIDTIQLGEIEGVHHGTYRYGMWWWNNRGYTPAGVEAWNSIRAIDYLQSRPEVDPDRIGVTGRSGGGAYSWWAAALDERVKVAVPVAGITNLKNHVVDGCVEGHCDCMFMVNTYRWDYAKVAAMVAPRPLLISNTDKDPIFPLDGVIDVYTQARRIYKLYGAESKIGLQITEGPHQDTQELRVHAFRWFNRFLKDDNSLITTVATPFFETEDLKVFDELPDDERVTTIQESFVPKIAETELPATKEEYQELKTRWMTSLQEKCFRGWPELNSESLNAKVIAETEKDSFRARAIEYTSQAPYRLTMFVVEHLPPDSKINDGSAHSAKAGNSDPIDVHILDQPAWNEMAPALAHLFPEIVGDVKPDANAWKSLRARITGSTYAIVAPRGVGLTQWSTDKETRTHIRRRFMLLGQTAASMQIYDVRRSLQALAGIDAWSDCTRHLTGSDEAAVWALYASLFEDRIDQLTLVDLPARNRDAPDILNISRYVEMPQDVMLAADRVKQLEIKVSGSELSQWQSTRWPDFCRDIIVVNEAE